LAIETTATDATSLPLDRLAMSVLSDLAGQWNERSYVLHLQQQEGFQTATLRAVEEALGWLRARGLTGPDFHRQSSPDSFFITRSGNRVLEEGLEWLKATERLQEGLHRIIEQKARPQFLLGEYELAVFASMKAIEVRVRKLGGFSNEDIGVALMNSAFGPKGPLVDAASSKGEQEGMRALFTGAYAVLRNPSGHREVNYDDVAEAAEAVQTASLLMRILDRVEKRLKG
jgi:uncharacterized protein (TIGR02391 family)